MRSIRLGMLATVAMGVLMAPDCVGAVKLFVSPHGKDVWSGGGAGPNAGLTDGPFASLERARDEVRKMKAGAGLPDEGVVIELQPGVYELSRTFELTAADSGTAASPIVYRAARSGEVRLVGGRVVAGWQPVTDPAVLGRLDEVAKGKVWQADLKAHGVTDFGEMTAGKRWGASLPGLEVFFDGEPMTLARWPNKGFVTIPAVFGTRPQNIRGTKGFMDGIIGYKGDRPSRWLQEKDVMLHGYWFWDWADQRLKIQTIDTEQKRIMVESEPQHHFGFRKGMYYYAYNLLPELDRPGEWYLDREVGTLYLWPPAPLEGRQVLISVLPTLVHMKDVSHVVLNGMVFEGSRSTALRLGNVTGVRIERSVIRNTGDWGISLSGKNSTVVGCDLYNLASGGISMSGGDRKTLTPAGLTVDNCHLYRFGRWNPICKPGVRVGGVGNRVTHCLFNDAPHMAVMWGGNDHLFEFNEFHSVVLGANDAGIMYAGYNPAMRGHMIRYNYFHHVYGHHFKGCNGVYLDDMFCSATIYGNVFQEVPRAAFIGGGHDNIVENNIFVDCKPAVHVDARMLGWAAKSVDTMRKRLEAVPYKQEPWRSRYPQLLTYLEGNYAEPRGNVVSRNICWGGSWNGIRPKARPGVKLVDNLVGEDPKFVDAVNGDFRLQPDSPAFALGFKPIPFDRIGLYEDPLRVTWPVKTEIRYPDRKPGSKKVVRPKPVFPVRSRTGRVTVDGNLGAEEWNGLSADQAMRIAQGLAGEAVAPPSTAWVLHDEEALYVSVDNAVDPAKPLRMGNTWGSDDCVELAFKNPAGGPAAPILILRGFPSGHFVSSDEAGAKQDAVRKAIEGVRYAAKVVGKDRWIIEWRIPFASLGIDPAKTPKIPFSLTVRKSAGPAWVLWTGTHHATWNVDKAGFLDLK